MRRTTEQGAASMACRAPLLVAKASVACRHSDPARRIFSQALPTQTWTGPPLVAITDKWEPSVSIKIAPVSRFALALPAGGEMERPADRPQVVRKRCGKAFKVAQTEKPGATHLDLPEDVARLTRPQASSRC